MTLRIVAGRDQMAQGVAEEPSCPAMMLSTSRSPVTAGGGTTAHGEPSAGGQQI